MLTEAARSRLSVVLVGARNPQNIGAVARAMHDFGFADLRVVNAFTPPFEAARTEATSAVNAGTVMQDARIFSSLAEAIADCTLVAGTTAVGERELRQPVTTLQEASPALLLALDAAAQEALVGREADGGSKSGVDGRVALLFGSEKTGLTKEELSFCSLLLTVPMHSPQGRHLSMNLGQAVAVCLYELTRSGFEGARGVPSVEVAGVPAGDRERVLALLTETMERSGYARRFPANSRTEILRQLAWQLGQTKEEAVTWMGVLRQLLRVLPPGLTPDNEADLD